MRKLLFLIVLAGLIYLGATVNLGRRTFFGHIANIWKSDEAQQLKDDISDTAKPVVDKARRKAQRHLGEYLVESSEEQIPADAGAGAQPEERP